MTEKRLELVRGLGAVGVRRDRWGHDDLARAFS